MLGNDVTYTYGTSGTGHGRPVRIDDGTCRRERACDVLGNVVSETRTMAPPGTASQYRFTTEHSYDSWRRKMTKGGLPKRIIPSTLHWSQSVGTHYYDSELSGLFLIVVPMSDLISSYLPYAFPISSVEKISCDNIYGYFADNECKKTIIFKL